MDRLEIISIALVALLITLMSILTYVAVLALDMDIKQNNRDLENFRSQGLSVKTCEGKVVEVDGIKYKLKAL